MPVTTVEPNDVLRRLECERGIYLALRDLSRRQAEIIEGESDVEWLLEVLGRKQALMGELEAVERELAPFKREWQAMRDALSPADRAAVEERVRALRLLLEELLALEERGRVALTGWLAGGATGVPGISQGCTAAQAYGVARRATQAATAIDHRG